MKACGKAYHDTLGIVVYCSEETPCRDCLLIEVGRLEYVVQSLQGEQAIRSAPVAVEVPEMRSEDLLHVFARVEDDVENTGGCYGVWEAKRLTEWFRERIKPIGPSRIKDGERAVPAEELDRVRSAGIRLLNAVKEYHEYKHDGDPWTEDARVMQETSIDELRGEPINEIEIALRSGEAEGG